MKEGDGWMEGCWWAELTRVGRCTELVGVHDPARFSIGEMERIQR